MVDATFSSAFYIASSMVDTTFSSAFYTASSNVTETDLSHRLVQLRAGLRPGQQRMADWDGGPLAISAVPGAGKSTGMAIATAIALAKRMMTTQQERTTAED
ncbi:MAG: hypothetical protein F6K30_30795 [Cyanothece sp. SIO2G6]|nr:hypothetical protein [Cyanothece sp. SIO2G6]